MKIDRIYVAPRSFSILKAEFHRSVRRLDALALGDEFTSHDIKTAGAVISVNVMEGPDARGGPPPKDYWPWPAITLLNH